MHLDEPIVTPRLRLKPLERAHASGPYRTWMQDPRVLKFLEARFTDNNQASLEDFIASVNESPSNLLLGIFLKEDARHIGNIKLGPIDDRHRRAEIGLLIGESECWGHGYATESIRAVADYALGDLGLHKVTAGCYSVNEGSIRAFLKAGFTEEGRRKRHFLCDGEWVDLVQLGLMRGDDAVVTPEAGGETPIPYGRQMIGSDDVRAVTDVLGSDFLTTGPAVQAFERELAAVCGARYAVAVSSGTAALHCAYAALDLKQGDEVVVPALTFAATASTVLTFGARPRFADIDAETRCVDPNDVERKITERTRALCAVDFAGLPADYHSLRRIAAAESLPLVADACHSIGGRVGERPVGSLADLTVFSFHPVKSVTTGEGGAVVTDDPDLAERARRFRNHGIVREGLEQSEGGWYYEVQTLGLNYRLSDIHCALGCSQLKKLEGFKRRRAEIVARYQETLADCASRIRWVVPASDVDPAWHLFAIEILAGPEARRAFYDGMRGRGIGVQVHYVPVNRHPLYRELGYSEAETPTTREVADRLVSLPLYPSMLDADVDRVVGAVRETLDEIP